MKKLYIFPALICFSLLPFAAFSQLKDLKGDPAIKSFENSSRTIAPFSILFKEDAGYTSANAPQLFSKYLGATADQLNLKTHDITSGISVDRYQQYFKGIKVEHGNYIIASKNNVVSYITGDFFTIDPRTVITPAITEDEALTKAWLYLDGAVPANDKPAGELVFVEDGLNKKTLDGTVHLAYKFFMASHTKALTMEDVYVDAATGKILFINLQIMTGCYKNENKEWKVPVKNKTAVTVTYEKKPVLNPVSSPTVVSPLAATIYSGTVNNMVTRFTGGSYRLEALIGSELYPTHIRNVNHQLVSTFTTVAQFDTAIVHSFEITDADNNWTAAEYANANKDNTALDVQWGAQRVYDYWKARHSRNSWNNKDSILNCYVHGDVNWDNAFWQGSGGINSMFYGDGSNLAGGFTTLTSLDVTGHEIGHGVCQSTSNLTYLNESGGMNEGFSDIWGASIEHFADPHEVDAVAKSYFDIGEEITVGGGALRSMSNPKLYGQPDTYLGTNWYAGALDNGGVHTNSGVLNHWFYLLVMGGTGVNDLGNTYSVSPLGWVDAEHIAFLGETSLAAGATYANCRTAMINAATTLFGACSVQTIAVTNAFYAAGIGAQFVPCGKEVFFTTPGITVSETATPAACPPSNKTITITIALQNAASQQTDATLSIVGGTATSNVDYIAAPATVTWLAGATGNRTFTVTLNDDHSIEGAETIILGYTLNNHSGTAIAGSFNQTYTITVNDDDVAPTDLHAFASMGTSVGQAAFLGPFEGSKSDKRMQNLYRASELTAAGFKKGNINRLYFDIYQVTGNVTFNNFNLRIDSTNANNLNSGFVVLPGPTTIYSGAYSLTTANAGFNGFAFPTPFYWNGSSNIIIESCYDNSAVSNDVNLFAEDLGTTNKSTAYVAATSGTGFCTAVATSTTQYRPLIGLQMGDAVQSVANTIVSDTAYLGPNADVPFYSASDGKIMARVKNNSAFNYGCTRVVVDRSGTGATTFWRSGAGNGLTDKSFTIIPTTDNPSGSYDITLFYSKAEHDGWETATGKDWETVAKISKIKGHTISEVTPATTGLFANIDVSPLATRNSFGADYMITATFNTGFSGFAVGDPGVTPLPIRLVSFTGVKNNEKSLLHWVTSFEQNNSYFEVETSKDGVTYYKIGSVPSKGNSNTDQSYDLTDNNPSTGINYYRLRQVDIDGRFTYSNIVVLNFEKGRAISIYPIPATDKLTLIFSRPVKQVTIHITGIDGKQLYTEKVSSIQRNYSIPVRQLASGTYLLETIINDERTITRFVKQ
ncbi:MAG: M4 family metallopeptidase [Ferruginibacter sp.]